MQDPSPEQVDPRIDFQRFFELAVDVFVVTDSNGRFAFVNDALVRLLGVDRETILANPWSTYVHPDDVARSAEENAAEFATGRRTVSFENRYVDAAGGIHWMDWNAELDPRTGLVYGVARDVTEQKVALAALVEAQAAAEEARAAAESANRAKSEFLSRMSHELRTPLNAVLGFAQILQREGLTDAQAVNVDYILEGGRRLLELIDEALDISRIEIGAVSISVEPVRVADVVAGAMSLVGPLAADRIALRSSLEDDDSRFVMADRQRVHQVLVNFLSNAIKYTPTGSTATLGAVPAGQGWLRIAVSDDGPGIAPELQSRLFVPFERIGAEQHAIEGTGLGLAHSKALVERMGGRVGVDSTVGVGSTFWLELPLADPPADALAAPSTASAASDGAIPTTGTLLYIEDNPANVRLIELAVGHRAGVRLLWAGRGRAGLELAREHRPDLIVLDLHLPDMGGEAVLQELRGDLRTTAIPVLILSADATRPQVDQLLAAGAQAYLTKPLDVDAFLAAVDRHLGTTPS